jgi:hypothetical protein
MQSPQKIPMTFMTGIVKINPKGHLEARKTTDSQGDVEQKGNAGGITIPDIRLYYRDTVFKTTWYWNKNRYKDKCDRIEIPDINPHTMPTCFLAKLPKIYDERKTALSTNVAGKIGYLHAENLN